MTAAVALQTLEREIERLFPAGSAGAPALCHLVVEIRASLASADGAAVKAPPLLDMLEDVLEALMRETDWRGATD